VQDKGRIEQVVYHTPYELGSLAVVNRQKFETGIEAPALLARMEQCDIERREPARHASKGVTECGTLGQLHAYSVQRSAKRSGRRSAFENFQGVWQANACRRQRCELVIELSLLAELFGRNNEGHGSSAPLKNQSATRSRLPLRSRLLRSPTI
jgi:hypothetical protein